MSTRIKDAGIAIRHSRGYLFYTAGSRTELEGTGNRGSVKLYLRKIHVFVIENILGTSDGQTGGKRRPGSAGSDNEAIWSCKRRVTEEFVQNDTI